MAKRTQINRRGNKVQSTVKSKTASKSKKSHKSKKLKKTKIKKSANKQTDSMINEAEPIQNIDNCIYFYKPQHEYGFMSNFYASPFKLNGKSYPTNEHYFQSKKFEGTDYEAQVAAASSASLAFQLGRTRTVERRPDWEAVKEGYMLQGLRAKFNHHPILAQQLLDTGTKMIVEHTKNDAYWADGGDGSGKNRLGVLLMKIRDELRDNI